MTGRSPRIVRLADFVTPASGGLITAPAARWPLPSSRKPRTRGAGTQRRRTATNRTGVPGTACAAAGRSRARTTAITG